MSEENEVVAMLVVPSDYVYHLNQVAGLTTRDVIFLKRKFASTAGYELVKQPLEQCTSIAYFDERPVLSMISGALLTALIGFVLVALAFSWNDLGPGTAVPIGALGTAGLYGVRRLFMARRHRFVFTMQDQTRLSWTSRAGEYELWKASTQNILEFARTRRLMHAA